MVFDILEPQRYQRKTTNFDKFRLLMWKNFLIQWRHKVRTFLEISMVFILTAPFWMFEKSALFPHHEPVTFNLDTINTITRYKSDRENAIICDRIIFFCNHRSEFWLEDWVKEWKLVYLPQNECLERLLNKTVEMLSLDGILSVDTSKQIEDVMDSRRLLAAIEFDHPDVIIYSFFFRIKYILITCCTFTEY